MKPRISRLGLDGWGASASTACAVHCAVTLFLPGLPLFGVELLLHPACEVGLLLVCSLIALTALLRGALKAHGRRWPLLLFVVGLLVVWIAHFAVVERYEVVVSVAGAAALAAAHLANLRCCHRCAVPRPARVQVRLGVEPGS
jgi:hypothetical protein